MLKRTCTCGDSRKEHAGETVTLSGWVNTYRDQGKGLVFIDLRDRYGMTQVVFDGEDSPDTVMELGATLRREDVISVEGTIRVRFQNKDVGILVENPAIELLPLFEKAISKYCIWAITQ